MGPFIMLPVLTYKMEKNLSISQAHIQIKSLLGIIPFFIVGFFYRLIFLGDNFYIFRSLMTLKTEYFLVLISIIELFRCLFFVGNEIDNLLKKKW